ncbi:MAG: HD-GYP domain-containing protein [Dehalococcoidia bacterium]
MRRLRIDSPVSPGATLARDVTGPNGEVIARAGHALTDRTLQALRGRGVAWCYVDDRWGEGLHAVPLDGGRETVRPLLRDFNRQARDLVAPLLNMSTQRALEAVRAQRPLAPLARTRFVDDLPSRVREFIELCDHADRAAGYLVDRGSGGDEDGHSIGVAAVTAHLATLVGMDARERVAAVGAALIHDVGMVFVPAPVLAIPHSQRSIPERIRYEDHAILGEAMLDAFGGPLLHLAIVAGEHHEAADGSGYPRQRTGGHRVLRTAEEKRDFDRLTLTSELVAVADAYERIVSPAPGYGGHSPAAARHILETMAGRTLNREIVHRLLASFPVLPLGTDVRVVGGPYEGMGGLVSAIPAGHEEQPDVRLFLDPQGRPLAEPLELSLSRSPETVVEVADEAKPDLPMRSSVLAR